MIVQMRREKKRKEKKRNIVFSHKFVWMEKWKMIYFCGCILIIINNMPLIVFVYYHVAPNRSFLFLLVLETKET